MRQNLPAFPTPFIGRADEIRDLSALLETPDCRLLTLVGPGGIGKTRLAVEVARCVQDDFPDGVYFVPLTSLASAENLAPTFAHAMGIELQPDNRPRQQILDYLRDQHILLILDNFEHLLEGSDLLVDVLGVSSMVKMLVTSREVINLQEEWVRLVEGMPYPVNDDVDAPESYGAIQLFADCAQRVRSDFSLDEECSDVIRICQLCEGMPLALELAASWRNALHSAVIADKIEAGLEFLAAKQRNVEARHRTIQAVFDQSWLQLTEEARTVFASLSVFHGGFTVEAAEQVTGASLPLLASLVDKSFIRVDATGRYDLHQLLRQYAAAKLDADLAAAEDANDRHCRHYARFVADRLYQIAYGDAQEVVVEIDNLRAAWSWALAHSELTEIAAMTEGLGFLYSDRMGLLEEIRMQFERATAALEMDEPAGEQGIVYGLVLTAHGVAEADVGNQEKARVLTRTGIDILRRLYAPKSVMVAGLAYGFIAGVNLDEKVQIIEEFIAISRELDEQWRVAHGFFVLGYRYRTFSRYDLARSCGQQLLAIARQIDSSILKAFAHRLLGEIAMRADDFSAARQHLEAAIAFFGDLYPLRRTRCLWYLGMIDREQGRYAEAEQRHRENLAILESIGLSRWYGTAHNFSALALLHAIRGDHGAAQGFAQECLAIFQEGGEHEGVAGTWVTMGYLAAERGDSEDAIRCYSEAWRIGQQIGMLAITLEVVMGFANLFARTGNRQRAVEMLALGFAQTWDTDGGLERRPLYQRLRDDLELVMDPADFQTVWSRGEKLDLETTVSQLLAQHWPRDEDEIESANEALPEPLTPRELETLALVAQGRSNRQIAKEFTLSINTAKGYVHIICQKLDADNRTHAVARARELGLL